MRGFGEVMKIVVRRDAGSWPYQVKTWFAFMNSKPSFFAQPSKWGESTRNSEWKINYFSFLFEHMKASKHWGSLFEVPRK